MIALLLGLLLAAVFAPAELDDAGLIEVPGGRAVHVRVEPPEALPRITEVGGAPVAWWGLEDGALVPAADATRVLRVTAPGAERVVLRVEEDAGEARAWAVWEREALDALARGLPLPAPPEGGERLLAGVVLRAQAVQDPGLAALGLSLDLVGLRPPGPTTHRRLGPAPEPGLPAGPGPAALQVEGPGEVVLRLRPLAEGVVSRFQPVVRVDGQPWPTPLLSASDQAVRALSVPVGPGEHLIELVAPAEVPLAWTAEARPLRPSLASPRQPRGCAAAEGAAPVQAAELAWLCGDRAGARAAFGPLAEHPDGAVRQLALARLIALAAEDDDAGAWVARGLAEPPGPGLELIAAAALGQAHRLDDALVQAAFAAAKDPDLVALARWLDARSGGRPLGLAVLEAAARPYGPDPARSARLQAGATTRFTRLEPAEGGGAVERVQARGPGVPRVRVGAGEAVDIALTPHFPGRAPLLRLVSEGPLRATLDGQPLVGGEGAMDFALHPGHHRLEVHEGEVLVLDAEGVTGGRIVYSVEAVALPAAWVLPPGGVPLELRLDHHGAPGDDPCPLLLDFDVGWTTCLQGDRVLAPSGARRVRVEGAGHLSLAARVSLDAPKVQPLPPAEDPEALLASLTALTLRVDAGDAAARLDRAEALGRLGLLSMARADLLVLLRGADEDLARRAEALALALPPERPSAPEALLRGADGPAPASPAAALALRGVRADPADPEALLALADDHPAAPWLRVQAAELLAPTDPVRAFALAVDAGPPGEALALRLAGRAPLGPLGRPEQGGGLVTVEARQSPLDPDASLAARAVRAMTPMPWPEGEGLTLRGELGALVRVEGEALALRLVCRPGTSGVTECRVRLRVDEAHHALVVPAGGEGLRLDFALPAGLHELELPPPGPELSLGLRLEVDGALLDPVSTRFAWRVTPGRPTRALVVGPTLVRLDRLDGEVRLRGGGREATSLGGALWLAVPEAGPVEVEIDGEGTVFPWLGVPGPAPEPLRLPPGPGPVQRPADALAAQALDALAGRPPLPRPALAGPPGSLRLGLTPIYERIGSSQEWWTTTELQVEAMRRSGRSWQLAQGWARGPDLLLPLPPRGAAGGRLEAGLWAASGWLGLRLDASRAWRAGYALGGLNLSAFGARDWRLGPDLELRGAGLMRVGRFTPAVNGLRLDPRAWNGLIAERPAQSVAQVSLIGTPARELRWELGVEASLALDTEGRPDPDLGGFLELDLLLGQRTWLSADLRWLSRFDDGVIEANEWGPRLSLGVDQVVWTRDTRRWGAFALVELSPFSQGVGSPSPLSQAVEGRVGVTLLLSPRRGLADLPPYQELFRGARGWP